jgi:chromosome segregation ATPase
LADAARDATAEKPEAAELLRAALEKIVFFEWRLSELAAELSAAQTRCANAESARAEAEDEARAAAERARLARMQCAELEADRSRLAALLANPAHARAAHDAAALEAERQRAAALERQLDAARAELSRARAERERMLSEMMAQARTGEEGPAALAQFISELRAEVIALRDHQKRCEALLAAAGIAVPEVEVLPPPELPRREPEALQEARRMLAEGRLSTQPAPAAAEFTLPGAPKLGAAAHALADQCLRTLASTDPQRREQAARHLAASPLAGAAPALATALGTETDPRVRAQLARALAACGGDGAAEIVAALQCAQEPPLVRMAALDALCALPARARAAVETAALDASPAVRRRAAALAVCEGLADLVARLALDSDASVRAAAAAAQREPAQAAPARSEPPLRRAPPDEDAAVPALPRDPVRAALHRLVLKGGAS